MSEPAAGGDAPALACPRCGSPVDERQEYCLECGLRLPREVPGALARRRPGAAPGEGAGARDWLLPAALGLVVAVLGAAAAVGISEAGGTDEAISTATGGNLTFTDTGETLTAPEPGQATTAPPETAPPPPATTAPATPPATTTWPARKRGWTIVLLSLPQRAGRPAAEERAAEARRRGLRNVGVLNSSRFASLHPGYFVVFTGVFDSQAEAAGALQRARAAFAGAYQREIVP